MINRKKLIGNILAAAAVVILFVLADSQCKKDRLQMEKLQDALTGKEEKIAVHTENLRRLQAEFARDSSMEEYTTETGFAKKGGVYLIDNCSQLESMSQMIKEGAEIEPGVAAAEASYRLRNDLDVKDWFAVGTENMPFCGKFDGDGHSITGQLPGDDHAQSDLFRLGEYGQIENLEIHNFKSVSGEVSVTVSDEEECLEMEKNLTIFPDCKVRLSIKAWNLDTQKIADELRERYVRNRKQENYFVSVFFDPGDGEGESEKTSGTENAMAPFCMLAGEDWGKIIEEAMEQEEGYLRFIKLERIGGLSCCTFEIGELESGYRRIGEGYHMILEGEWEERQIPMQHLFIPYTEMEMYALGSLFYIETVDINYDGKQDLLIHEGASGGSGGSWENYRAIVWKEETGQFEYYPSFPEQLFSLEFDRQRVVSRGRLGACLEYVIVYGVVNGEYVCTEELIWEHEYSEDKSTLSYYKMGKLVQTHIVTGMEQEEWWQIYPDLDYWMRG